jgi:hypothetical protein
MLRSKKAIVIGLHSSQGQDSARWQGAAEATALH